MVVEDDVHDKLLDDPSELSELNLSGEQKKNDEISSLSSYNLETLEDRNEGNDPIESVNISEEETGQETVNSQDTETKTNEVRSSAAELFEERQRQYLKGRKATKNITDNQGMIIVRAGETITDLIIDRAKNTGKLVELVMNNEA